MAKLDKDVNSIGKGWFIARLAIDYGLIPVQNIDFGSIIQRKPGKTNIKTQRVCIIPF